MWKWHVKVDNRMQWSNQSWDTAEEAFADRCRHLADFHGTFANDGAD